MGMLLIFARMAENPEWSASPSFSLYSVVSSFVWIRLVPQHPISPPLFSADDPISAVLMRQMDSLPLNIHHMPHQNLPLLHFAPVKNEHPLSSVFFQDNKSRLPCHQKHRWSRLRHEKFYFLWSLTVKLKILPDSERTVGASLIHLNPHHYYANESNSAHLILTEIGCWFNCFARTVIHVKSAVEHTRRS